ncbi:MAG: polyprenol monophosphomannose synthase [Mariniblastus sp.]|nr:polyprenol monophosphomannose synthase [Mariniblastus sp.]
MSETSIPPKEPGRPTDQTFLVVIATLNERENLPILVPRIFELIPAAKILVIDDDSPDGTGQWCDDFKKRDDRLEVIHRVGERGLGSAALAGFRWGLRQSFDFIATMDADLSHDPAALSPMLAMLENDPDARWGGVIGSRYVEGGAIQGWPWYRHLASRTVNTYVRWFLRLKTYDNTSGYRVYRSSALRQVDLSEINSTGYAYLEEILWRLQSVPLQMAESPIVFVDRTQGRSKVRLSVAVHSLFQVVGMSIRNLRKPKRGGTDAV